MSDVKVCNKCKEIKNTEEFYNHSVMPDGLMSYCKVCIKACRAKFYQENKDRLIQYQLQYYNTHKEEASNRRLKYYKRHREEIIKNSSKYYQNNKDKIIKQKIKYEYDRKAIDPLFRLIHNLRRRVRCALHSNCKAGKTVELLGCTPEALRNWISYQFEEGMNWNNYGKWHVDHVKPCASFNLEDPEEQKRCFHWTNLQPLWAKDNLIKGAKYEQL